MSHLDLEYKPQNFSPGLPATLIWSYLAWSCLHHGSQGNLGTQSMC